MGGEGRESTGCCDDPVVHCGTREGPEVGGRNVLERFGHLGLGRGIG